MSHYRGLQFVKQWNVNNVPHARTFPRVLVNMVSDRLIILSKRVVTPIFPDHPMYFQCDWQGKVDWRGTTHHTKLTTYIRNMHSDTLEDADEDQDTSTEQVWIRRNPGLSCLRDRSSVMSWEINRNLAAPKLGILTHIQGWQGRGRESFDHSLIHLTR